MTGSPDAGFEAPVTRKVGPVKATFKGGGTKLTYDAEAQVGGRLAQLGSRTIDAFTKRLAETYLG